MTDEQYSRRVDHTARLMFEALANKNLAKLGFFQLANRLLLGLQGKYILQLYVEFEELKNYNFLIGNTFFEDAYNQEVSSFFSKYRVNVKGKKKEISKISDFPQKMDIRFLYKFDHEIELITLARSDTENSIYKLRISRVNSSYTKDGSTPVDISPIPVNSKETVLIKQVISCLTETYCKDFDVDLHTMLNQAVHQGISGAKFSPILKFLPLKDDTTSIQISNEIDRLTDIRFRNLIDEHYKKIKAEPIKRYIELPVRVIFHRKLFILADKRYSMKGRGGYRFETRIVLPESQKMDILDAINFLKDSPSFLDSRKREFKFEVTKSFNKSSSVSLTRSKYPNIKVRNWFFEMIKRSPVKIFEILERPLRADERLFCDSCLVSGVVHHREDVLIHKMKRGLKTPFSFVKTLSKSEEKVNETMQLDACYFFLFSLMSTTKTKEKHDLLLTPIRIGGAPFFCASTIYGSVDSFNVSDQDDTNNSIFTRNWYFYNNMIASIARDLRKEIVVEYLNILSYRFNDVLSPNNKNISISTKISALNQITKQIQRFFPFELITFAKVDYSVEGSFEYEKYTDVWEEFLENLNKVVLRLNRKASLEFNFSKNEFFPRYGMTRFIERAYCLEAWDTVRNSIETIPGQIHR